ncbi:sporulation YhaL family protein [Jeotgalibacillus aurantiacus]|uniref:sporulation YhaL family protein n=1 Tax=Jeotgalibacillus aurantiacus TaxID=2763266 RepID=UPI001D09A790|nr:sporulation YhaL family protein [Jeotgalibacillus aurantiacus]
MFPIWIDIAIGGIIISFIMFLKTAHAERKQEVRFIEEHGEAYIKRIEDEKRKKMVSQLKNQ